MIGRIALFLIGLYSLGSARWGSNFSEHHLSLPFLNFPIFISEILLAVCLLLWAVTCGRRKMVWTKWHTLFVIYWVFVVVRALVDYAVWGPLAFRNAALFYYPAFAFLGYYFYKREYFSPWSIYAALALCIVLSTRLFDTGYFVYTSFALAVALLFHVRLAVWRALLAVILICSANYAGMFVGSRTNLMGTLAASFFLIIVFVRYFLKGGPRAKTAVAAVVVLAVLAGVVHFADKNGVRSLLKVRNLYQMYLEANAYITLNKWHYQSKPLTVALYEDNKVRRDRQEMYARDRLAKAVSVGEQASVAKQGPVKTAEQMEPPIPAPPLAGLAPEHWTPVPVEQAPPVKAVSPADGGVGDQTAVAKQDPVKTVEQMEPPQAIPVPPKAGPAPASPIAVSVEQAPPVKAVSVGPADGGADGGVGNQASVAKQGPVKTAEQVEQMEPSQAIPGPLPAPASPIAVSAGTVPAWQYRSLENAQNNSVFRLLIWQDMFEELKENRALLGVGFGKPQRSPSLEVMSWGVGEWSRDGWITPHNVYLHMIYRLGIVGALVTAVLFGMVFYLTRNFILLRSKDGILLVSILIYWLMTCNFLVILELPHYAIPFWALMGLTLAYCNEQRKNKA